jgi:hypothetical protein
MSIVSCDVGLDYHDETIRVCALAEDGELFVNRNVERPGRCLTNGSCQHLNPFPGNAENRRFLRN